jgi:DNA-binding NtrC family response regulator
MNSREIKMLLVENDLALQKKLHDVFTAMGFKVSTSSDGRAAFDFLQNNLVDVVVTELHLAELSGADLLLKIKRENVLSPRFVVMAEAKDLSFKTLCALGADGFLSKPFDGESVRAMVRRMNLSNEQRWREDKNLNTTFTISKRYGALEESLKKCEILLGRSGFFLQMSSGAPPVGQVVKFELLFLGASGSRKLSGVGRVLFETKPVQGDPWPGIGIDILGLNEDGIATMGEFLKKKPPLESIPHKEPKVSGR